ncbi:hypothetical protein [Zestomonas carbonaria]|nr:hypothetical protein [Pseudomonas carbonaria]
MLIQKPKRPYLTEEFIGTGDGCGIFIPANKALYAFVKDNPSHSDRAQVASKALIIGRSLAVSVERRGVESHEYKNSTADFYERLASSICESDVEIEAGLLPVGERLTPYSSGAVVKVHSWLCDSISIVTGGDSSSFASKYLHFHYPTLFPIMDSRARTALSWVADEESLVFAPTVVGTSKDYRLYVSFYLEVRGIFEEELGRELSLRQVDNILLNRYEHGV